MQKVVMTSASNSQGTESHINFGVIITTLDYMAKSLWSYKKKSSPSKRNHLLKFIMK